MINYIKIVVSQSQDIFIRTSTFFTRRNQWPYKLVILYCAHGLCPIFVNDRHGESYRLFLCFINKSTYHDTNKLARPVKFINNNIEWLTRYDNKSKWGQPFIALVQLPMCLCKLWDYRSCKLVISPENVKQLLKQTHRVISDIFFFCVYCPFITIAVCSGLVEECYFTQMSRYVASEIRWTLKRPVGEMSWFKGLKQWSLDLRRKNKNHFTTRWRI